MANSSVKNLNIDGNVIISGSTTSIDVQQLATDDPNITLNDIASPTDSLANGGGFTLKGTTDHTFNWLDATDSWTSSEHIDLAPAKEYKINTTSVLNATTLGAGVINSSVTSVGTLTSLQIDTIVIDGTTIGLTTDTDLITLTNNTVTVAGTVAATELTGGGTGITGITTSNITVPASPGDFLYNNAGAWGGITPPITVALGGTGSTTAAGARTNLGLGTMAVETATNYLAIANNLSDITPATARTNLGLGTTNSPGFGGEGTGSITITATPSSGGTVAPTFSGTSFMSVPVAAGSGHKWVIGNEQDGDLAFSYFTINDAGANTSSAVGYITADPSNTRLLLGNTGGTPVNVVMSGLGYPTADGTANQVLTTNGSGGLTFGTPSTTNITEGTNLYYTDARADARVTWTNLVTRAGASGPAKINVGENAGLTSQGNNTVAVGKDAGKTTQGANAVAVGSGAGQISQVSEAVAVGAFAGNNGQGISAVAVGNQAGQTSQGADAVAVGQYAGQTSQGIDAVAVGKEAGQTSQGSSAIAIGLKAGETNQGANSIVLSAIGSAFSPTTASAFFVNPVRNVAGTTYLQYNATTKEVTHIAATTSSVAEGTNLYYTDARADARIVNAGSANWNTAYTATNAATNANTASTIVKRDGSGNFAAGQVTANTGVILGNNAGTTAGTVRWTGTDFQGYDGSSWESLTSAATAQLSGAVATFTTTQSTQSATYVDVPGYTTAITVTNSNIINVQVTTEIEIPNATMHVKLVRVAGGTPTDLYEQEFNGLASGHHGNFTVAYADVHGQANGTVITYKLMYKSSGSGNDAYVNPDPQSTAQIFLSEITTSPITVSSVNGASGAVVLTTANIAEGSNLYYTAARDTAQFNTDLATKSTTNITEGTNLYYTAARADARIAAADTDDLTEGSTNLYHQADLGSVA
jgi:hypothetical protein